MIHEKIICESDDNYLAAFYWPEVGHSVNLTSDQFPKGWALKGGQNYRFQYDDETGSVDAVEV